MKYVRLIFRGMVLNYERHLTFQFLIYRKIMENSLKDLICTHVTKVAQESRKIWMDENCNMKRAREGDNLFIVYILNIGTFKG